MDMLDDRRNRIGRRLMALVVSGFVGLGLASCTPHEHPEHPEKAGADPDIETVAKFLEQHVAQESGDKRYVFEGEGRQLALTLEQVHRERLSKTAPQQYFVCADLRAEDGTVYDLDFWVKSSDSGLTVTETTLHKVSGEPLYTWSLENGVWVRKFPGGRTEPAQGTTSPTTGKGSGAAEEEHPEHPEEAPAKAESAEEEHPEHPEDTR